MKGYVFLIKITNFKNRVHTALVSSLIFLIGVYRKCISPGLGARCRFYPSCSQYSSEVLIKYGLMIGLKKSACRLCKCHPFCKGGIDLP